MDAQTSAETVNRTFGCYDLPEDKGLRSIRDNQIDDTPLSRRTSGRILKWKKPDSPLMQKASPGMLIGNPSQSRVLCVQIRLPPAEAGCPGPSRVGVVNTTSSLSSHPEVEI